MKKYSVMYGIGSCKYVVNSHDGVKRYPDGSEFWDIAIFKNKKKMNAYIKELVSEGYEEV